MKSIFLVLTGGAIGSVSRYGFGIIAGHLLNPAFPWPTFIINFTGCTLAGFCYGKIMLHEMNSDFLLFLITGFLGGFTTFSGLATEIFYLFRERQNGLAFLYLFASNLCLLAFFAGYKVYLLI